MRTPILAAVALVAASVALAQGVSSKTFTDTFRSDGGFTALASPSTVADGVDLSGAEGWQVLLSADAGRVLTGAGSAQCWYYGAVNSPGATGGTVTRRWMRCPGTVFDVTPTAQVRDYVSLDFSTSVGMGRVMYMPASIGTIQTDGGAGYDGGVDVTIEVRKRP